MHNKTFIVDGKVMITGGRNVADEYYDYDRSFSFRDRDILLIGDAVQAANASFKAFWNHHLSVAIEPLPKQELQIPEETLWRQLHQYACDEKHFWKSARRAIGNFPNSIGIGSKQRHSCGCRMFSLSLTAFQKSERRYVGEA